MKNKEFPCYQCLKFPVCKNKTHIICSSLFFLIITDPSIQYDGSPNQLKDCEVKSVILKMFPNVKNIKPEKGYYDEVTTMQNVSDEASM
jgi:hypothetical protein